MATSEAVSCRPPFVTFHYHTAPLLNVTIAHCRKNVPLDRPRLRRAVRAILRDAGVPHAQISIAVVDDPIIAKLHERFLGDPEPTDVLSFLIERSTEWLEGEVVVSADTAIRNAPRYRATADVELLRYVIHGVLHLVGYDDVTPRKRSLMRKQEEKYLGAM
jgi:probable rRNA maturation factor